MLIDTQTFERTRPLGGHIVADFAKKGTRPRQGSFTVPKELYDVVSGLTAGANYTIGLEIDDEGPCRMKLVSVEEAT